MLKTRLDTTNESMNQGAKSEEISLEVQKDEKNGRYEARERQGKKEETVFKYTCKLRLRG